MDHAEAVAAAVKVALGLGVAGPIEPQIVNDGFNLAVRLAPHPILARVATATADVRDVLAYQRREVVVLDHLARAGAPAVRPAPVDPGPHQHGQWRLILMRFHENEPSRALAGAAVGASLRAVHDGLRGVNVDAGIVLPDYLDWLREVPGLLDRAGRALPGEERAFLAERAAVTEDRLRSMRPPMRPLHGDVHLGNVLRTAEGPIWADFEDACLGPVEWDLASLQASTVINTANQELAAAALDAYGCERDTALWEACLEAHVLMFTAWAATAADRSERAAASMPARLAWHHAHAC